ncbi:hypothetical protein WJX72_007990 [[Myrmecia] bisecta]|uniref:RNA helicase n=1 Tax=[Myrmecia] bisecta TaxID=41462 RepID=A0AAW1P1U2_9CHLO
MSEDSELGTAPEDPSIPGNTAGAEAALTAAAAEAAAVSAAAPLTFDDLGLDPRLLRALDKKAYQRPTLVQRECIPKALEGHDLIARAHTGSGKTMAYLLPIMHKILSVPKDKQASAWQALVLVPTRELSQQVKEEADTIAANCGKLQCGREMSITAIAGDGPVSALRNVFLSVGQIVVSTPGRIADGLAAGLVRPQHLQPNDRSRQAGLSTFVLDEADLMLSMEGYDRDLQAIAPQIPRSCQCLLMSATTNDDVERLQKLVLHNPLTLNLLAPTAQGLGNEGGTSGASADISHFQVRCDRQDKMLHVMVILKLGLVRKKVLLFVNSIDAGIKLRLFLESFGIRSAVLNAELPLNSRHHILQEFNKGLFDNLIATDEAASKADEVATAKPVSNRKRKHLQQKQQQHKKRKGMPGDEDGAEFGVTRGIDFKGVRTVINVDAPADVSGYVHRVGRTGRAGQAGVAVSLFTPEDTALLQDLEPALSAAAADQPEADAATVAADGQEAAAASKHGLRLFARLTRASVEGLRYRAEDVARSLTKAVIKDARAKELRLELLNSQRLQAHFEDHPGDLALLKHDKPLAKAQNAPHLKHIPAYLKDSAAASAGEKSFSGNVGKGVLPAKKRRKMERGLDPLTPGWVLPAKKRRKMERGLDPLKVGFVRAPKKGGDIGEPLTEMEQAAIKAAPKNKKKGGQVFTPKSNVRKHRPRPKR